MKSSLARGKICVKKSPVHGYGVFAEQSFSKNDVIEECVSLVFPHEDKKEAAFSDFYFGTPQGFVLPLGFGGIYNHSSEPNATYVWDDKNQLLRFMALKPIHKGQEIFVSYGVNYFASRELIIKKSRRPWRDYIPIVNVILRFSIVLGCLWVFLNLLTLHH